jgi:hypothetical protein
MTGNSSKWSCAAAVLVPALLLSSACSAPRGNRVLSQGTLSYLLEITTPGTPPRVGEAVTYAFFVRDRKTGQPIEAGEGHVFARAASDLVATLVKAPQVGRYQATLRFPRGGGWQVGVWFRDSSAGSAELTRWSQQVQPSSSEQQRSGITPPWLWGKQRGK